MYVSIERDGAKVEDARRRTHNVERHPCVAELRPEDPVTEEVVHAGERHHQWCNEKIRDGQRRKEEVAYSAEAAICIDGHADEDIAGHW